MDEGGQQDIMSNAWRYIEGDPAQRIFLIADHASRQVPPDMDLGIDPDLLDTHIAIDLGVAELAAAINRKMGIPAILGGVSRLVVDLNREEDAPHVIPTASDGRAIPGNAISHQERLKRIDRFWKPYHREVERLIKANRPHLLVSLHSFTPRLESEASQTRPWEVGILYNQDDRAARIAIPVLEALGVKVGDQLPYSGKLLNATMNRHGETNGIAYLGIEMRQDLIADPIGVSRWLDILAPVISTCRNSLGEALCKH